MSEVPAAAAAPPLARRAAPDRVVRHVYAHYPFCRTKCPYCDFNSHAGRERDIDPYVEALLAEARAWRHRVAVETLFVGGGTPTHAAAATLERYLVGLREALGADDVAEWTVEANPGSLDREKVRALRRAGVHRVSLGAQSFDDTVLGTLGRAHQARDVVRSVELLREGGVERFSLDLILAVPGQRRGDQERDLRRAIDLAPEHVSTYVLTYEEGTVFTRLWREGRLAGPDDERELAHLHLACERLGAAGYRRYEISNHARPGAESRHNLAYWRNADWVGLGAGAHGHVGGLRWKNVDDPAAYAAAVRGGCDPVEFEERVPVTGRAFEFLLMGLRLREGVDLDRVRGETGVDVAAGSAETIGRFAREGLLVHEGSRLRLTERGLDVANAVIGAFAPEA